MIICSKSHIDPKGLIYHPEWSNMYVLPPRVYWPAHLSIYGIFSLVLGSLRCLPVFHATICWYLLPIFASPIIKIVPSLITCYFYYFCTLYICCYKILPTYSTTYLFLLSIFHPVVHISILYMTDVPFLLNLCKCLI